MAAKSFQLKKILTVPKPFKFQSISLFPIEPPQAPTVYTIEAFLDFNYKVLAWDLKIEVLEGYEGKPKFNWKVSFTEELVKKSTPEEVLVMFHSHFMAFTGDWDIPQVRNTAAGMIKE